MTVSTGEDVGTAAACKAGAGDVKSSKFWWFVDLEAFGDVGKDRDGISYDRIRIMTISARRAHIRKRPLSGCQPCGEQYGGLQIQSVVEEAAPSTSRLNSVSITLSFACYSAYR